MVQSRSSLCLISQHHLSYFSTLVFLKIFLPWVSLILIFNSVACNSELSFVSLVYNVFCNLSSFYHTALASTLPPQSLNCTNPGFLPNLDNWCGIILPGFGYVVFPPSMPNRFSIYPTRLSSNDTLLEDSARWRLLDSWTFPSIL